MARRRNNSGSPSERSDRIKRFIGQISVQGERVSKGFETEAQRDAWLKEYEKMNACGVTDELVITFLQDWLEMKKPVEEDNVESVVKTASAKMDGIETLSPTTYILYKRTLENYVYPRLSRKKLMCEMTREDVKSIILSFLKQRSGQPLGKNTSKKVNGMRTAQIIKRIIHKAFVDAPKLKVRIPTTGNPADNISLPYKPPERVLLGIEEFHRLVRASSTTRYKNMILLACFTGVRRSEALGLMWKDVDWETSILHVRRQAQRLPIPGKPIVKTKINMLGTGTGIKLRAQKTTESKRQIPIGKKGLVVLRNQQKFQELEHQLAIANGKEWHETGMIFSSTFGTPMEPKVLFLAYKRLLKQANVNPDFHFHDLRHTSISVMRSRKIGANIKNVGKRTGQKSERAIDIYTHTIDEDDRQIAELLEEILNPPSDSSENLPPTDQNESPNPKSDDNELQQNCSETM